MALRSLGQPNSVTGEFDFWNDKIEMRRLFSELLGTFFLVLVAVGGGMVSAGFGGNAVPVRREGGGPGADGRRHHPVHGDGLGPPPQPGG